MYLSIPEKQWDSAPSESRLHDNGDKASKGPSPNIFQERTDARTFSYNVKPNCSIFRTIRVKNFYAISLS